MKEILIETARPRRRRKVPEVLNVPELPLDAQDFDAFVDRLQPSKTNATEPTPLPCDPTGRDDPVGG